MLFLSLILFPQLYNTKSDERIEHVSDRDHACPDITKALGRLERSLNDLNIDFDYCWRPAGRRRRVVSTWKSDKCPFIDLEMLECDYDYRGKKEFQFVNAVKKLKQNVLDYYCNSLFNKALRMVSGNTPSNYLCYHLNQVIFHCFLASTHLPCTYMPRKNMLRSTPISNHHSLIWKNKWMYKIQLHYRRKFH